MTALIDIVFLAAYFPHLACWIYPDTFFWPAKFLWTGLLLAICVYPWKLRTFFPNCFQDSLYLCIFQVSLLSWCWPAFADFEGSSLYLLDLNACSLAQIREVLSYNLFKHTLLPPFWCTFSSGTPMIQILLHFVDLQSSLSLYSWSNSFLSLFSFIIFHNFIFSITYLIFFFHPHCDYIWSVLHLSYTIFLISAWLVFKSFTSAARVSLVTFVLLSSPASIPPTIVLHFF